MMKDFFAKCFSFTLLLALVGLVLGAGFLWWYSGYQAAPILAPSNPVFDDLERDVLEYPGLRFEHFSLHSEDGVDIPAVIVQASGQVTPQMSEWSDRLAPHSLPALRHTDYVLVSVEWDHGIISALPLAEAICAAGMTCVLWEPRGRDNAREYCTHGLREKQDVSLLIDALEQREGREGLVILGVGRGFGASMLLQAAAHELRLTAMVAIDSYASLGEALRRTITGSKMLRQAKIWLIDRHLQRKVGYEIFDVAPVESVISMRGETPLLLMNLARQSAVARLDDALNLYRQSPSESKQVWTLRGSEDAPGDVSRLVNYRERKGDDLIEQSLEVQLQQDEKSALLSMIVWVNDTMGALLLERERDVDIQERTSAVTAR